MQYLKILPFFLIFIISCNSESATVEGSDVAYTNNENVVEVIARDYSFQMENDILSGWTTFKFKNEGEEPHFFLLNRLPEDKTYTDYVNGVTKPFDVVWDSLRMGKTDKAGAGAMLGKALPDWYGRVTPMGGVGIIEGGATATSTLKLTPGNYVMECYIKMANGMFHTSMGMIRPVTVLEETSVMPPPNADVNVSLSNSGIERNGNLKAGLNTIAVTYKEHPQYGLGNDLHVVRLNPGQDINEVVEWMDWMNMKGLQAPAPAEFLGGVQEMPVGDTAYFTIDLQKGEYALIGESNKEILEKFSVE